MKATPGPIKGMKYLVLVLMLVNTVLVVIGTATPIFKSPVLKSTDVGGTVVSILGISYEVKGADTTSVVTVYMFKWIFSTEVYLALVDMTQYVTQEYNIGDIPCEEARNAAYATGNLATVSIFFHFFTLCFLIGYCVFGFPVFKKVTWVLMWLTNIFVCAVVGVLLGMLFRGYCVGEPHEVPKLTRLASPNMGFVFFVISWIFGIVANFTSVVM